MSKASLSKNMTVEELKVVLRGHSLPTTGKKSDLQKRLDMWKLPKKELQQRAKKAGLPTTGTKALLVRRIQSGKENPPRCCDESSRKSPRKNIKYKSEIVDFGKFLVRILGRKGPIKLDTNLTDHLLGLEDESGAYDKLIERDVIDIGKENKPIDKADLKNFLNKLDRWQNFMNKFNHSASREGRSYIFEGIKKGYCGVDYFITWGS